MRAEEPVGTRSRASPANQQVWRWSAAPVAVCGAPDRHESAGAARLSVVVLVLFLADAAAGDGQDGFEQGVVAADGAVGVSVEREALDDDVERAEAVDHVLGDGEGAVVI